MQYYMIEWEHEEEDEPWRVYIEMDRYGCLCRKIEVFRVGIYQTHEDLETPPMDPREIAGSEGHVSQLNRIQFEDMWTQSREIPDGFMGMYF